jgi:predicted MPP superfamily phosphohydrolase
MSSLATFFVIDNHQQIVEQHTDMLSRRNLRDKEHQELTDDVSQLRKANSIQWEKLNELEKQLAVLKNQLANRK